MSIWSERQASGNPVYPYEWELHYVGGTVYPRLRDGIARVCSMAPRIGLVRMRVSRGPDSFMITPNPGLPPIEFPVARAMVKRPLIGGDGEVTGWRFGFKQGETFVGILIDGAGRARHVSTPWT